ncbi:unnamed protein product [Calypogeia fissa]
MRRLKDMPTESRERIKKSLDTDYGDEYEGNGAKIASTDHRTESFRSLRAQHTPRTDAAADRPPSNGSTRRPARKTRTLSQTMSADNSPVRTSSNRAKADRRVKDAIRIHEQLLAHSNGSGPQAVTVEHGNGNGTRRPPSRSSSRPSSAGLPRSSKGSSSASHRPRQEFEPDALASTYQRVTEITELSPSPTKDDAPAFTYEDHQTVPVSSTHLHMQMARQMERRASSKEMRGSSKDMRASSKDINRKPFSREQTLPVEVTHTNEEFRPGKQNGLKRTTSMDKRSSGDRKPSPAASPPNRRQSSTFSHTRSSSSSAARRSDQPESRSSSTTSRHADKRSSLGGNNNGSSSLPLLKEEAPKRTSSRSKPQLSNDGFFDFEFTAGSDNPTTTKSSSSPDVWQEEEPSNSATFSAYARHEGGNEFTTEIEPAERELEPEDFEARLYTRKGSRSGSKSRQESDHASDATRARRRSLGNRLSSNGFPVNRHESNGNSTQEDHAESVHNRHVRHGSTSSGNFRLQENGSNFGASRRFSEVRSNNYKSFEVVSYRSDPQSIRRKGNVRWLLKGVAAATYNGGWLPYDEMVPFPDDVDKLNKFLNDCRNEAEAGLPGRFLTVVLGNENSDLDSIVSTITYAYLLSSIDEKQTDQESKVFVPVINMRQEDFVLHTEAVWLFKVTGLDTSKLLFVDQINLQYYHRFGNLKLVLVDHSKLAAHQETLQDAVIQIVDHNLVQELYSWVPTTDIQQVGSCCTIIAERFVAEAPHLLAGRGLNRLLLGPILLDTANLDPSSARCTARDTCMAAFLIHGAGRYGQQGFFRLLRKMKFDVSTLNTIEMLRKDFKQWTLGPGRSNTYGLKGRVISAAMSTLGVPLKEIMTRRNILEDLRFFARKLKLDLHLIVTGYYDNTDRYKREILIVPGDIDLKDHLRACFRPHKTDLQLSYILIPGLPDEMLVYKQGLVTASRTILRQILKDYFEM